MNKIELHNLKLKTFTEQDALDYCILNNINSENITELYLFNNELTDISVLKYLKNIKNLFLGDNEIKDISYLKSLKQLKILNLFSNNITDISCIKNLKKLEFLNINNNLIQDISVIQYLNNLQSLDIRDLELESDQIQYINSCKNLKQLLAENGFKDMSIIK